MIRICHFADHLNGKQDGVFTHIKMIVQSTHKDKYKHYLCIQGDPYIENEFKKVGGDIILIPSLAKKISLKVFIEFYKKIKSYEIDIIQTHFLKPYCIASINNIFLRKKHLFNYHGLFINNEFNVWYEKLIYQIIHLISYLLKSVNLAIVPSFRSGELLANETKLFKKIEPYYGTNFDYINHLEMDVCNRILKIQSTRIAFIGRIEKEKNLDFAINLISEIQSKDIKLFVFGEGSLLLGHIELANALKIQSKIEFLGYVENASSYLKYMDLLLITSHSEGMPFVLWEAMVNSVPVISSNVGGIPEIVKTEKCGLVFEKDNMEDAVDNLLKLINNPALRKQMGKNGKRAINEIYTLENFGKRIDEIYSALMEI